MKENHVRQSKVTSSDQKKTKLNNLRVMTCVNTIKTIVMINTMANASIILSMRMKNLARLLCPPEFMTAPDFVIA